MPWNKLLTRPKLTWAYGPSVRQKLPEAGRLLQRMLRRAEASVLGCHVPGAEQEGGSTPGRVPPVRGRERRKTFQGAGGSFLSHVLHVGCSSAEIHENTCAPSLPRVLRGPALGG